ncbi:MAG: hypothetical protein EA398_14500 [Deltaproteobacteria bacterium]|nr:MAG: hypothetical protein EA398_14500 [Deltaproteobacteria bacterium]
MEPIEKLERHQQAIQQRFIGSMAAFAVFGLVSVVFANAGTLQDDLSMLVVIVLIVVSLLVLPRSTAPAVWPRVEGAEDQDRMDLIRDNLRQLQLRATWLRLVYLLLAAVFLLLLPRMMG